MGARAQVVIPLWVVSGGGFDDGTGSVLLGNKELIVTVTGRLTGTSESQLWTRRQDLVTEATFSTTTKKGTLVDNQGRSYADMVLVSYVEAGPVKKGRVWSMGYTATLRRVTNT
jgi:hypothetical protein